MGWEKVEPTLGPFIQVSRHRRPALSVMRGSAQCRLLHCFVGSLWLGRQGWRDKIWLELGEDGMEGGVSSRP